MFFDKNQFREDLKPFLAEQDIDILINLYEARRVKNAAVEVAKRLGLTPSKVKQRALKVVDHLRRLAGYAVLLERVLDGSDVEPETPKSN